MAAAISAFADDPVPRLSPFETVFIRTVLEHRGLSNHPTLAEFSAALEVLKRYDEQQRDDSPDEAHWVPRLDEESVASLRAKAFVMFGAARPTPAQWQKAMGALFGPLLCETCG
ncbi:MAG: hypothetical protein ABI645_01640 [Pseudomonadota bacterium]